MILAIIISSVAVFAYFVTIGLSDMLFKQQIEREIERLYSASKDVSNKTFSMDQIKNLPEPVKRYFTHSLEEGQHYVSYIKLKHTGEFRQGENQKWMSIEGQEYFTTETPGFIWIGKISLLPLVWITGVDKYLEGRGTFQIKIMSIFTIADDPTGKELDESELMRWLAEAPLFPTALLPSSYLHWEPVDSDSAKAIIDYGRTRVEALFHFDKKGEIVQMNADRYRAVDNSFVKEKWLGHYSNYAVTKNILVPWDIEVSWNSEVGNFTYAKFKIKEIQYDNPIKY
ncbi:hypothetical protein NMY3_01112 [Candidatus Nitrosocosmicus oleophilus]|uniref:Uncharacterized protein n=1 Tax=Candidatus Nitrosocosmicus oleophilus TaxID=1353260 RepID=A0A654LWD2_9ARCH|nr:hypothetical protein NMY3_01112 [Candidatus Nitrosocosmicus oleophilus]